MQPMTEASGHIGDDAALRALAARDGYVLVRNLLPRDTVLAVAEQLGAIMADAGWIESDVPLAHAHATNHAPQTWQKQTNHTPCRANLLLPESSNPQTQHVGARWQRTEHCERHQ